VALSLGEGFQVREHVVGACRKGVRDTGVREREGDCMLVAWCAREGEIVYCVV
jgi:hypothetical protein